MNRSPSTAAARALVLYAAALLAFGVPVRPASAQCPADGSPPPCRTLPVAARALDPNRIAILPARTSGADPALAHLREGLVELLSGYFNGELGPQAVEPGEALQGWKRAGAGPEPATPAAALRVARQLGAGQVVYSSVAGTARRFTVTTSILRVPAGTVSVGPVKVEGSADSLATLVRALATQLLSQREGAVRNRANDPGTADDEAADAYLKGMAAYRAQRSGEALQQFRRAIQRDSAFALAAYRMVIMYQYYGPSASGRDSVIWRRLRTQRGRLSGEQRQLLDALADAGGVLFRMAALPRLERAMPLLLNSAEAWDIHGGHYFHVGALLGYEDWAARAKAAFLRAVALDSGFAINAREWLTDLAFYEGDGRAHARYAKAFPGPRVPYQAALLRGDQAAIRAARIEYARDEFFPNARVMVGLEGFAGGWPPREVDSLLTLLQLESAPTNAQRIILLARNTVFALINLGRPGRAAEVLWLRYGADSNAVYGNMLSFAQGDSDAAERTFAMLDRGSPTVGALRGQSREACDAALSRLRRGDTTGAAAIVAALRPAGAPALGEIFAFLRTQTRSAGATRETMCGEVLRGVLASLTGADGTALRSADSLMRAMPMNCCDYWNYDLGVAFARRGEYAAAAAAVRRRWIWQSEPAPRLAIALLQEGRWAAKAGDTTAAIKAYHQYLAWRENPEPVLIPQRDSARADLAALEKAIRNRKTPGRGGTYQGQKRAPLSALTSAANSVRTLSRWGMSAGSGVDLHKR